MIIFSSTREEMEDIVEGINEPLRDGFWLGKNRRIVCIMSDIYTRSYVLALD